MITHEEYKDTVDTTDATKIEQFNKILISKSDTYLTELIGADLVAKLKAKEYPELMPFVKKCMAWEIYLHFVTIGNVIITPIGGAERSSDFSRRPEFLDKKSKTEAVTKVLRGYEKLLLSTISAGTYPEAVTTSELSTSQPFNIFAI